MTGRAAEQVGCCGRDQRSVCARRAWLFTLSAWDTCSLDTRAGCPSRFKPRVKSRELRAFPGEVFLDGVPHHFVVAVRIFLEAKSRRLGARFFFRCEIGGAEMEIPETASEHAVF